MGREGVTCWEIEANLIDATSFLRTQADSSSAGMPCTVAGRLVVVSGVELSKVGVLCARLLWCISIINQHFLVCSAIMIKDLDNFSSGCPTDSGG